MKYDNETNEKVKFYLDEIDRQNKLKFLKFFQPPNPIYFIPITFVILLIIEILSHFYFVPSLIGMYLIFECLAFGAFKVELAEKCIVEEVYMEHDLQNDEATKREFLDLGFPLVVTMDYKINIVENIVSETKRSNILNRLKNNGLTFFFVVSFYLILFILLFTVFHLYS